MRRSVECPQCRKSVVEVKKNATMNNLIEKYLLKYPHKKRPPSEIEELEKLNKITAEVVEVLNRNKFEEMAVSGSVSSISFSQAQSPVAHLGDSVHSNYSLEEYNGSIEEDKKSPSEVVLNCANCSTIGCVDFTQNTLCVVCNKYFCQACIGKGYMTELRARIPLEMNAGSFSGNLIEQQHVRKYICDQGLTFANVYSSMLKDLEDKK
eukprot:TRINITY_DN6535_c0_g1_i9.p1 TRINITY_DN6535_c0_g1~~TRINITY_DN6535_c0_g1_i9.p1  ORF type:complete len:208 (+),score=37.49 TRINITY_DN6535_c0_g1_i9:672-1295(+)